MPIAYNYSDDEISIDSTNIKSAQKKVVADLDAIIADWKNIEKAAKSIVNCNSFKKDAKKSAVKLLKVTSNRVKYAQQKRTGLVNKINADVQQYCLDMDTRLKKLEAAIEKLGIPDPSDNTGN